MVKLVALDIDGTLLNREGEITERTRKAIGDLMRSGVQVTLCTGRNLPLARQYADTLEIALPVVTCNGAEIRRLNGEIVERRSMSPELTKQVYRIMRDHDALFDIYWDDRIVIESKPKHLQRLIDYYRTIRNINPEYDALLEQEIDQPYMFEAHDIGAWMDRDTVGVEKFFVMEQRPERFEPMFEEVRRLPGVSVATSHLTSLEINDSSADKGRALRQIAEACGVAPAEVAVVGDGMNDVSMFEYAGISVAMGNASEQVKRHANFVTAPNTEDGVAQALERWL